MVNEPRDRARGPWPVKNRKKDSRNTVAPLPSTEGTPSRKSRGGGLFGFQPDRPLDQKRLTFLFEEQKRLTVALRRQARLVKRDVAEVVSVQAEQLRQINSAIAVGFDPTGEKQLFKRGTPTPGQVSLDKALGLQGVKSIGGEPTTRRTEVQPPSNRRRLNERYTVKPFYHSPQELGTLVGPLLRDFSRAKDRGYRGPPSRWLKGPAATKLIAKLHHRELIDSRWTGERSVFNRFSPLRWAVNGCCISRKLPFRRGFQDERLFNEGIDIDVLVRQARSVNRLKVYKWPRSLEGGTAWPTYPTLFESWEQLMRGKCLSSVKCSTPKESLVPKRPKKRILPGSAARAISTFVVGVRADTVVPRKFLAYFEYRWGFLILRRNHPLPRALVSSLTDVWKADITRMFLVYPIRYNDALRRIPDKKFYRLSGWVVAGQSPKVLKPRSSARRLRRLHSRQNSRAVDDSSSTTTSNRSGHGLRLC